MIFIVTLISLLTERFFDCSHLRSWKWYGVYQRLVLQRLAMLPPYVALAAAILPFILLVGGMEWILGHLFFGMMNLVFQIAILLYCLGPRNLWADIFACIHSLQKSQEGAEQQLIQLMDVSNDAATTLHRRFLDAIFIQSNVRVFGVVFWYALAGPIGAVIYRAVCVVAADTATGISQQARLLEEILNWLPARTLTLFFALGGHFVQVLSVWREGVFFGLEGNSFLLTECGSAAINTQDPKKIPSNDLPERNAVSLVDRALVIFLVVLTLVSLFA